MSDSEGPAESCTKTESWKRNSKIKNLCENVDKPSEFFIRYLSVARTIFLQNLTQKIMEYQNHPFQMLQKSVKQ